MSAPPAGHHPRDHNRPRDHDHPGLRPAAGRAAGDEGGVDHDQEAATARRRRLMTDIDRVRSLAAAHGDEHPDWPEVAALLDHLRATLARDLAPFPS